MAAAPLNASSTAANNSADIVLADNASTTVMLVCGTLEDIPAGCAAKVQIKTVAGGWVTIGGLNSEVPARNIAGPGTFRVAKGAFGTAFGVETA